jgi:hypothetical protein
MKYIAAVTTGLLKVNIAKVMLFIMEVPQATIFKGTAPSIYKYHYNYEG